MTQVRRALGVAAAALVIVTALAGRAEAWGPEGHRIVARVAYARLSARARREVARLLTRGPGESTARAFEMGSVWADEVRPKRPETSGWHYVNIPIDERGYDATRDCPSDRGCVVTAIDRQAEILADRGRSREEREEALKFVIHFVGDVHQPLHGGTRRLGVDPATGRMRTDLGGNLFFVTFFGCEHVPYLDRERKPGRMQMHYVWDTALLLRRFGEPPGGPTDAQIGRYAALMGRRANRLRMGPMGSDAPARWATESHALSRSVVYTAREGEDVREAYYERSIPVVEQRLALAGARLASVLERALARR